MDRLARGFLDVIRNQGAAPRQAAPRSPLPPPPQLSTSPVLRLISEAATRPGVQSAVQSLTGRALTPQQPVSIAERRKRLQQQAPDTSWGVYDTPYGPVAMPSEYGEASGHRRMGDAITDQKQIERAKNSKHAYTLLPEEQQREIGIPEGPKTGSRVLEPLAEARQIAADAKRIMDRAQRAGSMVADTQKKLSSLVPDRPEVDETAFAIVRNNQTNTTELVRREDVENAPDGFFTVITPNVNAEEAQRIMDAGLLSGDVAIRGREDMGGEVQDAGEVASAQRIAQMIQERMADRGRGTVKREGDTTLPPGPEPEGGYWWTSGGHDGKDESNLPTPPDGYVWVVDASDGSYIGRPMEATLVPMEPDDQGGLRLPDGVKRPGEGPGLWAVAFPEGMEPERERPPMGLRMIDESPGEWIPDLVGEAIAAIPGRVGDDLSRLYEGGLPQAMTLGRMLLDIPITGGDSPSLTDAATGVWTAEIPGTDISLGRVGKAIWNQDIPFLQTTVGDLMSAFFEHVQTPGDDAVYSLIDRIYAEQTGTQVVSETRGGAGLRKIPLVGDLLGGAYDKMLDNPATNMAADAFLASPLVAWIEQNPEQFQALYNDGYDLTGDGRPDLHGPDAVLTHWLNDEASIGEALWVLTLMDPLTWATGAAGSGKFVVRGGRVLRMADLAIPGVRGAGTVVEAAGRGIHIASRAAEMAGSMGLEPALMAGSWFLRKTGITAPEFRTRVQRDMDPVEDISARVAGERQLAPDTVVLDEDGRVAGITDADGNVVETKAKPGKGKAAKSTEEVSEDMSRASIEVGEEIPTDLHDTVIRRTDDGWEVVITNELGETTTRQFPSLDRARNAVARRLERLTDEGVPPRWERRPEGQPAPEGATPRFIDEIEEPTYRAVREEMTPEWVRSEGIQRELGSGNPGPYHAIESSRIGHMTVEAAARHQPDALPAYEINVAHYRGNPVYAATDLAIRADWESEIGRNARNFLSGEGSLTIGGSMPVTLRRPVASGAPLPQGEVSRAQVRAANTYVDMMTEHARWNPRSFQNPDFQQAWQRAIDLDHELRVRNLRHSPDGIERVPLSEHPVPEGVEFRQPSRVTNEPGEMPADSARQAAREGGPEDDVRSRYPGEEIETLDDDGLRAVRYQITEDIAVELYEVRLGDVPAQWRRMFPDRHDDIWYAAMAKSGAEDVSDILIYAPDANEAFALAEETLRTRGLIPGTEPGVDVMREVESATDDVVRMRVGPEQPPTRLTVRSLPKEGATRTWSGIDIEAVPLGDRTAYIAATRNGEFAFLRENGRIVPLDAEALRAGNELRLTWDGGSSVRIGDAGRHIYRMHVQEPPADIAAARARTEPPVQDTDQIQIPDETGDIAIGRDADQITPEGAVRAVDAPERVTPAHDTHGSADATPEARARRSRENKNFARKFEESHRTSVEGDMPPGSYAAGWVGEDVEAILEMAELQRGEVTVFGGEMDHSSLWTRMRDDRLSRLEASGVDTSTIRQRVDEILSGSDFGAATSAPPSSPTAPTARLTREQRIQRIRQKRGERRRASGDAKKQAMERQQTYVRAMHGEVEFHGSTNADTMNPRPRPENAMPATGRDPSGTVDVPEGEVPTPGERPRWADPDVPEPSDAVMRAVERGAGRADAPTPATHAVGEGGAHRVTDKLVAERGVLARSGFVQAEGDNWWLGRPITDSDVAELTRHTFTDGLAGDTFMERVTIRAREYGVRDNYRNFPEVYERQAIRDTLADYEKLLHQIHSDVPLVNLGRAVHKRLPRPVRASLEAVGKALAKVLGAWDNFTKYLRETALFHHLRALSYPMTQAVGNAIILVSGGQVEAAARMFRRDAWWNSRKQILMGARNVDEMINLDPILTPSQRMHASLGTRQGREIRSIYHGMAGSINDPMALEKALKKLNVPDVIARPARHVFSGDKIHAVNGSMFDASMRDAIDVTAGLRIMRREALPDFRNYTQMRLMEWGMDRAEARALWREFQDSVSGPFFSAEDVRRFFEPRVGEGRAIRLGRDWQGAANKIAKKAREEVKHYGFASGQTRADLVLSRTLFFHYFMSRQSNYYLNLMARHPFMINLYFNLKEQLEKKSEGFPPFLQNWVKVFGTPMGYQLFLNPVALASSYIIFNDSDFNFDNEGQTRAGKALRQLDEYIGFNPIIMEAANLLGFFGDDFAPDPLGQWRTFTTLTQAINFGRAHGLLGDDPTPKGNWYEQNMLHLREKLSGWNPLTEGAVRATSSEAKMDREVNMLIADEVNRMGIDPESAEGRALILDAMADPDSDLYRKAVKRWVWGEVGITGARFLAGPFLPRKRPVNEQGEDLYHSFSRELKQLVNTSDPRAAVIREQEGDYFEVGTETQREVGKLWTDIAFGDMHYPITVDGITYTSKDIHGMTRTQRIALANGFLEEYGLLEDYNALQEERQKWLSQPENKEYAQFRDWQSEVRDWDGGIDAYWKEAIKKNPDAAFYYENINNQRLLPAQRESRLTSMSAFMALQGIQQSVWDPIPAQARDAMIFDPANIANQAAQPKPYVERNAEFRDEVRKLPQFLREMQQWDAEVKRKQGEMGIDPTIPFNELPSKTRKEIEGALKDEGIKEPKASWQIDRYLEWVEQQPPGADTSVEAFFADEDRRYREGAPGRVKEAMEEAEPLPGPDRRGNIPDAPEGSASLWREITDLLNEHDHTRYPDYKKGGGGNVRMPEIENPNDASWIFKYVR